MKHVPIRFCLLQNVRTKSDRGSLPRRSSSAQLKQSLLWFQKRRYFQQRHSLESSVFHCTCFIPHFMCIFVAVLCLLNEMRPEHTSSPVRRLGHRAAACCGHYVTRQGLPAIVCPMHVSKRENSPPPPRFISSFPSSGGSGV